MAQIKKGLKDVAFFKWNPTKDLVIVCYFLDPGCQCSLYCNCDRWTEAIRRHGIFSYLCDCRSNTIWHRDTGFLDGGH